MKIRIVTCFMLPALLAVCGLIGCIEVPIPDVTKVEYYNLPVRKLPLPETYSRVRWSHPPKPMGVTLSSSAGGVPVFQPRFEFDLKNSNVRESVEAIAQAIGYDTRIPRDLRNKKVSFKLEGSLTDAIQTIDKQAGVKTRIDHRGQIIVVSPKEIVPKLPADA